MDGEFDIDLPDGGGSSDTGTSEVGTGANTPPPADAATAPAAAAPDAPPAPADAPVADPWEISDSDFDEITEPAGAATDAPAPEAAVEPAPDAAAIAPPAATEGTDAGAASAAGEGEVAGDQTAETYANPQDVLAPLFTPVDATLPQEERLVKQAEVATEVIGKLKTYDRDTYVALVNALYHANQEHIAGWVAEDLGITQESADAYLQYLAAGGQASAPAAETFPEPDEYGIVTLADGTELDVSDTGDKRDRLLYEREKQEFERRQSEARATREAEQRAERERQNQVVRERGERAMSFANGRVTSFNAAFDEAWVDPTTGKAVDLGEDAWVMDASRAYAESLMDTDPELTRLIEQAKPLLESGSLRAEDFGAQMDAIQRQHAKTAVGRYSQLLARTNQARRAAAAGQPVLPPGTRTVVAGGEPPKSPPQTSYSQIEASLDEELDQLLK